MASIRLILVLALLAASPSFAATSVDVFAGKRLFEQDWPEGALFNERSCGACHLPSASSYVPDTAPGSVIRLGNANGTGDPVYGWQVQTWSSDGNATAEAQPAIEWIVQGQRRLAKVTLFNLHDGDLNPSTKIALRRAPSLTGIGLLAQITESEILNRAKAYDVNGDGIHGRPAWLNNGKGGRVLGRFGWKATQPTIAAQTAAAFSRDMGLSTTNFPNTLGDCTPTERACRGQQLGLKGIAVKNSQRDRIVAYLNSLAPMIATGNERGAALFAQINCSACHATLHLANGQPVAAYTDLLLHQMGDGLNDGIKEGSADAGEWRTAPLWNVAAALKAGGLLHDGRARNVAEAVAWHDGEAATARARFQALSEMDRSAIVAFVSGL